MKSKFLNAVLLVFVIACVLLVLNSKKYGVIKIHAFNLSVIENLRSFSESDATTLEGKSILTNYAATRKKAIDKSSTYIRERKQFNIVYQCLCIISIIASFIVTIMGANKGLFLKENETDKNLELTKDASISFKRQVVILSAISILATTLSSRFSSYSDKSQQTANEMITMVKDYDAKMTAATSVQEAKILSNAIELDLSKY